MLVKTQLVNLLFVGCITFGDVKNPESNVSKAWEDERNFFVLEEIHTLPSVGYLAKIKNIDKEELQQV